MSLGMKGWRHRCYSVRTPHEHSWQVPDGQCVVKLAIFMNFELPCVHVAPKKGPPFLDTRARMRQGKLLRPPKAMGDDRDASEPNSLMMHAAPLAIGSS